MSRARVEKAPAKVNLTLRVVGRRADGYHDIESLVVFAGIGDVLTFLPAGALHSRFGDRPRRAQAPFADNLVLRAARALADRVEGIELGHFVLSKRLPVAAGLGGGSADAAAALRILARVNNIALDDPRLMQAARATGADVPVCLDPRAATDARHRRYPFRSARCPAACRRSWSIPGGGCNQGRVRGACSVAPQVGLARLRRMNQVGPARLRRTSHGERGKCAAELGGTGDERNDLEAPAIALAPVIGDVLAALRQSAGLPARAHVGLGRDVFRAVRHPREAAAAARALRAEHADWWVRATELAG